MLTIYNVAFFIVNEKFSLKHEEVGRPLYFDAQATTPVVSSTSYDKF